LFNKIALNRKKKWSLARAPTWATQSGGKRTKHEATVPPQANMYFIFHHEIHPDSNVYPYLPPEERPPTTEHSMKIQT